MYTAEIIDSAEVIHTQKIKKYSCFLIILAILPTEEFLSNWKLWANEIDFLNFIVSVLYFPSSEVISTHENISWYHVLHE
jgi:hypothetical protein